MAIVTRLAIILAAGQGIRLGEAGLNGPKAMLEAGGTPLLARSLRLLSQAGIGQVVLVTGYRAGSFESLNVPAGMALTKVHNPDFRNFGSALSLMLALHGVNEPCLVLDGDIIYEPSMNPQRFRPHLPARRKMPWLSHLPVDQVMRSMLGRVSMGR